MFSPSRRLLRATLLAVTILGIGGHRAFAGLIADYSFDEMGGSLAHDSVGGVNGTLMGGAAFAPGAGRFGGAISLNAATDSYVDMGNHFAFTSGDFSTQIWVKMAPNAYLPDPGFAPLVSKHHNGNVAGYFLGTSSNSNGKANFYASDPAPAQGLSSTVNINDNNWHQIVGVYHANGSIKDLYVDGVYQGSISTGNGLNSTDADFIVGGSDYFGTNTGLFTGYLDELQLYNNALTASQVAALFNASTVPEPASLAMLGMGTLMAAGYGAFRSIRDRRRLASARP